MERINMKDDIAVQINTQTATIKTQEVMTKQKTSKFVSHKSSISFDYFGCLKIFRLVNYRVNR